MTGPETQPHRRVRRGRKPIDHEPTQLGIESNQGVIDTATKVGGQKRLPRRGGNANATVNKPSQQLRISNQSPSPGDSHLRRIRQASRNTQPTNESRVRRRPEGLQEGAGQVRNERPIDVGLLVDTVQAWERNSS